MSSLERLPPDQRAVLALVLQRGRSYDEIANLLAIDRAAVRDRALAALDALGPSEPRVSQERRALITDYLLGQLPDRVRDDVRNRLARSPSERAWARVLAGELAPIASTALPEIPAGDLSPGAEPTPTAEPTALPEPTATPVPSAAATPPLGGAETPPLGGATARTPPSSSERPPAPLSPPERPTSRRGGGIFLALTLLVVVVVVIIALVTNSGSSPKRHATNPGTTSTPATTTTSTQPTGTSTTTATTPHIIAQINMRPANRSIKAAGIVRIVTEGKVTGVIVAADHLAPNTKHNAYAIWLAGPGGVSHLLGYVSPGVGSSGNLTTSGPLPANYLSYKELLLTLETTTSPKGPGPAILQGSVPSG